MNEPIKYKIVKTECFPCCWKAEKQWPCRPDNASHLYFRTQEEALEYIIKSNGELV